MTKNLYKIPNYWLTLEDCEILFQNFNDLLAQKEPIPPFNSRPPGKLEGIVNSINQTFNGNYLNNSVLDASASYFNQLIRGHAFINGNKRCAVLYTQWFMLRNNVKFTLSPEEMYNFAVFIARAGEKDAKAETTKNWCKEIIKEFT